MKRFLLLLISLVMCSCTNITPVEKNISEYTSCVVNDYTMQLTLDTKTHVISGTVRMDIVNNTNDSIHNLCIRNFSNAYLDQSGEDLNTTIHSILLDDYQKLDFIYEDNKTTILVDLPTALNPNDEISIVVDYMTQIPRIDLRFSYIQSDEGTLYSLTNCFPMLANYENGLWDRSPAVIADGECNFNQITNIFVELEIPNDYTVVASGNERVEDDKVIIEAKHVREMAIVACDYMQYETQKTKHGVDVNVYYLENMVNDQYKYYSLGSGVESMELFTDLIGPYPYSELDIVPSTFLGMEYPGLVMNGYFDTTKINYSQLCRVTSHEIGHQWFSICVGSHPYNEPWLDEGLTSYLEKVYLRSRLPYITEATQLDIQLGQRTTTNGMSEEEYLEARVQDLEIIKQNNLFINNRFDRFYVDEVNYYSIGAYNGGAYFLLEVREIMEPESFDAMMKDYYQSYYLKEATGVDFFNMLRSYDNSAKVNKLIHTYFNSSYTQ